jgi:molybdenum cofactor synthesis domain-containing protein
MMSPVGVCLIAIGNELLLGQVQDTNSHWLCRQITGLGGRVERVALVRDEIEAIVREIRAALAERFPLILTSGGLGPTPDDLTLSAVARAAGRTLVLDREAQALVAERYRKLYEAKLIAEGGLTPSREKMAHLPEGAIPLENHVGTAPGVLLRVDESTIVALPGVPAELKDIFQNALQPHLSPLFGAGFYLQRELLLDWNDESALAPLLAQMQQRWPQVYVKSRAKGFGQGLRILITLSMSGPRESVQREVGTAEHFLIQQLAAKGISFVGAKHF